MSSVGGSAVIPTYTWATKPATYPTGQPVFMSNVGTKGSLWFYDGTRWKPLNGSALLGSLDTESAGVNGSETVGFQYQMPAALLQTSDVLRVMGTITSAGTTNTAAVYFRVGTLGTTGDTAIITPTILSAAQRAAGFIFDFRLDSATTLRAMGGTFSGYGAPGTTAQPAAVTISNVSNSLWFNTSISGGATDAATLVSTQLWLLSPAN